MNYLLFVCGSLALFLSVQCAEDFTCYKCSGADCTTEDFNTTAAEKVQCTTSCSRMVTDGATTAVRGCSATKMEDDCTTTGNVESCYCNTDLCNGSTGLQASLIFFVIAMVAATIFNRL